MAMSIYLASSVNLNSASVLPRSSSTQVILKMAIHITDQVLRRTIASYLAKDSITENDVEIVNKVCNKGCEIGDNFLGQIIRVEMTYKLNGDKKLNSHRFIAKILDHEEHNGVFLAAIGVYSKESFTYEKLLPLLNGIAKDTKFGPVCYYTQEEPMRIIVMEDLSVTDYFMGDRMAGLDYDHCALVMRKLAAFHAASMVLADQQPELMKVYDKGITPMLVDLFYKGFLDVLLEAMNNWTDDEEMVEIREKVTKIRVG